METKVTDQPTITSTVAEAAQRAPAQWIDLARSLARRIREEAPAIDRNRRLPAELAAELTKHGFFHMLLPRDLGGYEVDPVTQARVVEEISKADGSAGWCVMIAAQGCCFAGFMPAEESRTVWGNNGIVAGTARPIGRAVWTETPEPGYVVSGRWPFASGSSHATWFAAECMVYDGDAPRLDASGEHVSRMVFVPRESVTVHDVWDTLGLRGTASNDFAIDESAPAFVPAARGFQVLVDPALHPWALYRAFPLIFINHGAQALGVAHAALETAAETAAAKLGWGNIPLTKLPKLQALIAEATALVESAEQYLYGISERLWDLVLAGDDDAQLRARVRLANSNAVTASVRAVDLLHGALATSAIFTKSPLERQFRDLHTASAHVMIGSMTYEAAGRVLLGQEAEFPFF
jgi:indole-3-acetate monooxygenase